MGDDGGIVSSSAKFLMSSLACIGGYAAILYGIEAPLARKQRSNV